MLDELREQIPHFFTYYTMIFVLQAMLRTICMALIGCCTGFAFGLPIAALRLTRTPWLMPARIVATIYVELFRRIPFLVLLFIVMFAAQVLGDISLFTIALIAICMLSTAFLSEIIRAGLQSVPRPQIETAEAMNFGYLRILFQVMLPQSWKVILPPAFAFIVMFIKDTSLASQLGVVELTFTGKVLMNRGFSPFLVYGVVLLAYFILSYPLSRLGASLEKYFASPRNRKPVRVLWTASGATGYNPVGGPG
jgi:polar amino acid transport system permease protein